MSESLSDQLAVNFTNEILQSLAGPLLAIEHSITTSHSKVFLKSYISGLESLIMGATSGAIVRDTSLDLKVGKLAPLGRSQESVTAVVT